MKSRQDMNRRTFLRNSAGVMAAGFAASHFTAPESGAQEATAAVTGFDPCERCALGSTGVHPTRLGMGTGINGWNNQSALTRKGNDAFMNLLRYSYDNGMRYYDLADVYGSHSYLKEAMDDFMDRDEVTIITKSFTRDAEELAADIERYRQELNTDYIDGVLLHCLTDPDWTENMKDCMDVLSDAQAKGWIKAKGVSCHNFDAMAAGAESPWVDILLARINPFGAHMDGPTEDVVQVLRTAHDSGKGVLGMKILGEGTIADRKEESLEFVLNLGCVDAMTIGFLNPEDMGEIMDLMRKTPVA